MTNSELAGKPVVADFFSKDIRAAVYIATGATAARGLVESSLAAFSAEDGYGAVIGGNSQVQGA